MTKKLGIDDGWDRMVARVGWWPDSLGAGAHRLLPSHLRPELEHHRHLETLGTISVS